MAPKFALHFDLKTTILLSSALALALNAWQYLSTLQQRADAFMPTWALANSAHPTVTPTPSPPPTATPSPAPGVATAAGALNRAGLKSDYAALYLAVSAKTGVPWQLLAAVHRIETGQAGDTTRTSYAGATGPMQFMPATFRAYGLDGDGNGIKDIHDLDDAMYSAGHYLAVGGAARGQYPKALYHYNHSNVYVNNVLAIARRLGL